MSFAFLPLYTGDYLRDTRHLTPMRHGTYLLALMYCWDTQSPMPMDEQECAGICNCRSADEIEGMRYILQRYFVKMDDGWYNKRMTEIVAHAERVSSARSEGGLKSAVARREKARKGTREKHEHELNMSSTQVEHDSESPSPSPSPSLTSTSGVANATVEHGYAAPDLSPVSRDNQPAAKRPKTEHATLPVRTVFQYWQHVMGHPSAILGQKRQAAIAARLKEGHAVDKLKQAIDGCKASSWHQGQNDRHQVYDDIELICRDTSKVEAFVAVLDGQHAKQRGLDDWVNSDNFIEGECRRVQA